MVDDYRKILASEFEVDRYKDFWLPWLDMVQRHLEKKGIKMVYEWSMVNHRLEFASVFTVGEQEFLIITFCPWGKSEKWLRNTANVFVKRIIDEKEMKERVLN